MYISACFNRDTVIKAFGSSAAVPGGGAPGPHGRHDAELKEVLAGRDKAEAPHIPHNAAALLPGGLWTCWLG